MRIETLQDLCDYQYKKEVEIKNLKAEIAQKNEIIRQLKALVKQTEQGERR